jgi:hypothetical protein
MSRARPGDKHLGESFRNVRFIATVAFKRLGVELAFPISGDLDLFEPTRGRHQITKIGAIAIPLAFGTTLSPSHSEECV